jgi:hypothetical protein
MPRGFAPSRKDLSQPEIEQALRRAGWQVCDTHSIGSPDLFCSKNGLTVAVECKTSGKQLKTHQVEWADRWFGFYAWGSEPTDIVAQCEACLELAYREAKFRANGFVSHRQFVDTVRWLKQAGMKSADIGRLYHVSRAYVHKLTSDGQSPSTPSDGQSPSDQSLRHQPRPEAGAREVRHSEEDGRLLDSAQAEAGSLPTKAQ